MTGTWIAVEFGGKRQTHAASGPEVRDLLIGQRLDRTGLHSRIGLAGLRHGWRRQRREDGKGAQGERNDIFHGGISLFIKLTPPAYPAPAMTTASPAPGRPARTGRIAARRCRIRASRTAIPPR